MGLIKIKASLSKTFHIQPSEIDKMPMWEFELYIKQLNELVEEENNKQQKEMDKHNVKGYMDMAKPQNMQKMMQGPDFSKMNAGSFRGNGSSFKGMK